MLYQPENASFLGWSPMGEHLNILKGGFLKGPAMRPASISFNNFFLTSSGFSNALFKFGAEILNN